jgi:signal transduction histidine kinase
MLGRIENSYNELQNLLRTQRRFVSDASHELRTPLTTIRGNVELLQKVLQRDLSNHESSQLAIESVADISAEAERMSRLVGDLLSLARADAGVTMEKKIILLKDIIDTAIKRAVFLPRTAEWKVTQHDELDDVYVEGHEDYLLQMVLIFIENAFKYTIEGSVYFAFQKDNGRIGITIEDTGIGISNEDVPFIFDRFYRADLSRGQTSGTGLGLSIAKWIVDEHGGSVEVRTALGKGTRFTIWLPTVISV